MHVPIPIACLSCCNNQRTAGQIIMQFCAQELHCLLPTHSGVRQSPALNTKNGVRSSPVRQAFAAARNASSYIRISMKHTRTRHVQRRSSSVGTATCYGLNDRGIGVRVPVGSKFSLHRHLFAYIPSCKFRSKLKSLTILVTKAVPMEATKTLCSLISCNQQ
jgi:hypothetical protein